MEVSTCDGLNAPANGGDPDPMAVAAPSSKVVGVPVQSLAPLPKLSPPEPTRLARIDCVPSGAISVICRSPSNVWLSRTMALTSRIGPGSGTLRVCVVVATSAMGTAMEPVEYVVATTDPAIGTVVAAVLLPGTASVPGAVAVVVSTTEEAEFDMTVVVTVTDPPLARLVTMHVEIGELEQAPEVDVIACTAPPVTLGLMDTNDATPGPLFLMVVVKVVLPPMPIRVGDAFCVTARSWEAVVTPTGTRATRTSGWFTRKASPSRLSPHVV